MTINDLSFYREDLEVSYLKNDSNSKMIESNYKFNIRLPFPEITEKKDKELVFRLMFKPESGQLWGFNQFYIDHKLFHQINFSDILNQNNQTYEKKLKQYTQKLGNITNNSREELDEEFLATDGIQYSQAQAQNECKTPDRDEQPPNLNTSVFLHSRLGLMDN
jgi:hypothetical protein